MPAPYKQQVTVNVTTSPVDADKSNGILLDDGMALIGVVPTSTPTNSAFTVQYSVDGTNYYDVSSLTSIAMTVNEMSHINPQDSYGLKYIRLAFSTAELTTNTTFDLHIAPVVGSLN